MDALELINPAEGGPMLHHDQFTPFLLNIKADLIYMDADHRESVIYKDLINYSNLLNNDGIIFGHDIDWVDVKNGVKKYCTDYSKNYIELNDNISNQMKFWQIL